MKEFNIGDIIYFDDGHEKGIGEILEKNTEVLNRYYL